MKKHIILITIIFILAAILRFHALGETPTGFHRDEAFLGYNAYSLLKTGKDMSGDFLPLHLRSFLFSPAGYSYFSIPFIALFGLSEFSVRFASALFGSLTVLVVYFLVLELFQKRNLAFVTSLLLAISPWHINLSRTATENVPVLFFVLLGVFCYLSWLRQKKWRFFLISFLSFGITLFLYQAARAFLPLFLPTLFLLFVPEKKSIKPLILASFFVIILPLFVILSNRDLSLRIRTVSIFATEQTNLVLEDHIRTDGVYRIPIYQARVFHNKVVAYGQQILQNYFSHFTYDFLFADKGFPDRYRVPLVGLLYILELPFLLIGVWGILQRYKKIAFFLLGWILVSVAGSGLTFDDIPNLQRILLMLPPFLIFIAFGLTMAFELLKRKKLLRNTFLVAALCIYVYSIAFYLHQYYVHAPRYKPWFRQDGYKSLVSEVNKVLPTHKKAIITDRESAPTIFFLFFGKYNPGAFQQQTKGTTMKDFDRISFGKYEFTQDACPLELNKATGKVDYEKNVLYVNSSVCEKPLQKELFEIKRHDDSAVFRAYGT